MPDEIPELTDEQRMRQRIARAAGGSMFTDSAPDSRGVEALDPRNLNLRAAVTDQPSRLGGQWLYC